jgi:hypothetical protein
MYINIENDYGYGREFLETLAKTITDFVHKNTVMEDFLSNLTPIQQTVFKARIYKDPDEPIKVTAIRANTSFQHVSSSKRAIKKHLRDFVKEKLFVKDRMYDEYDRDIIRNTRDRIVCTIALDLFKEHSEPKFKAKYCEGEDGNPYDYGYRHKLLYDERLASDSPKTLTEIGLKINRSSERTRQMEARLVRLMCSSNNMKFCNHPDIVKINIEEKDTASKINIEEKDVSSLKLTVRSANVLKNAEIYKVSQLVQKTERELLRRKNFGRKSLNEIKKVLYGMGLFLKRG